jgi:hypothetical protein
MKRIYKWNGERWAEAIPIVWESISPGLDDVPPAAMSGAELVVRALGVPAEYFGGCDRFTEPVRTETLTEHISLTMLTASNTRSASVDSERSSFDEWAVGVDRLLREVKE